MCGLFSTPSFFSIFLFCWRVSGCIVSLIRGGWLAMVFLELPSFFTKLNAASSNVGTPNEGPKGRVQMEQRVGERAGERADINGEPSIMFPGQPKQLEAFKEANSFDIHFKSQFWAWSLLSIFFLRAHKPSLLVCTCPQLVFTPLSVIPGFWCGMYRFLSECAL